MNLLPDQVQIQRVKNPLAIVQVAFKIMNKNPKRKISYWNLIMKFEINVSSLSVHVFPKLNIGFSIGPRMKIYYWIRQFYCFNFRDPKVGCFLFCEFSNLMSGLVESRSL